MIKIVSALFIVTTIITHTVSCNAPGAPRQDCIDTLQNAAQSAASFFVKIHAGEALVGNGITENVENTFTQLRDSDKSYLTGSTRVLARLYKENDYTKYNNCISTIIDQYLHADSTHPRLVALESLGKLGYSDALPEIMQDAHSGTGGFKAMARWVLSNNGSKQAEDTLAALLQSPEVVDYRGAAYALRFKRSVSDTTYQLLEECAGKIAVTETPRVYVLSALFVHAPAEKKETARKALLQQSQDQVPARYETCEALSINGDDTDLPLLEKLLKDTDQDVRVAASNAILKIWKRHFEK